MSAARGGVRKGSREVQDRLLWGLGFLWRGGGDENILALSNGGGCTSLNRIGASKLHTLKGAFEGTSATPSVSKLFSQDIRQ